MQYNIQVILNNNPYLKRYLHEHSAFYKDLVRNPNFIKELSSLMQREYGLTLSDRLDKIKDNITMINTFMDVLK